MDPRQNTSCMRGSRNFCQGGGGGGPGLTVRKQLLLIPQLIFYSFTEGAQWLFQGKLYFSKVSERVQHFPGGRVQLFPGGGVQMLIICSSLLEEIKNIVTNL